MTKKSGCRKTEYQKQFKKSTLVANIPTYFENKKYRAARRHADYVHTPFLWEDSSGSASSSESDICVRIRGDKKDVSVQKGQKLVDSEVQTTLSDDDLSEDETPNKILKAKERTCDLKGKEDAGSSDGKVKHTIKSADEVKGAAYTKEDFLQRQCPRRPDRSSKSILSKSSFQKPPFVAYGWADKEDEITRHRTYNILSAGDVHPSAVRASERFERERQHSKEREGAKRKKKRKGFGPLQPKMPVPSDWETEYSAHFKYDPQSFGYR